MHEFYMRRCLELARQGLGNVSPNPLVGAVIVKEGRIIGEGFHSVYGGPHAEVMAFKNATEDTAGATLYVNLEPCCHLRKQTPPCVPLVIKKLISHVVICNLDPNPEVCGKGIQELQASGVKTTIGVLEEEGAVLNEVFFHRMKYGTPFIHLKSAATIDGKIALPNGSSQWITGPAARLDCHRERHKYDAIMVGAGTIRSDNPQLTVRLPDLVVRQQPYRLILTRSGELTQSAQVFNDEWRSRTRIVCHNSTTVSVLPEEQIIRLSTLEPFPFVEFYQKLANQHIYSVWVEGGASVHSLFLQHQQAQRLTLYLAPKVMGQGMSLFQHSHTVLDQLTPLKKCQVINLGEDFKFTAFI